MRLDTTLLLTASLLTGCELTDDVSCNAMYAPSGVAITFSADDWEAGEWVVEVDGERCTVSLPSTDAGVSCEQGDGFAMLDLYLSTDGTGIDGGWLSESTPEALEITLFRDDVPVYDVTLQPSYEVDEPNGPGCGERSYADVEIALNAILD